MTNPYRAPRPNPIDPECLGAGGLCLDDLLRPVALIHLLQDNFDWLCHEERSARDIYIALFRRVDYERVLMREAMSYLNEAMWELGFRTVGENSNPRNPVWKWVQVA